MAFQFNLDNIKWQTGSYNMPEAVYRIKVPGITTVIGDMIPDPEFDKFVLEVGKERAEEIMNNAANRGTSMHLFIEAFMNTYSKTGDVSQALRVTQEETPVKLNELKISTAKIDEGRNLFYKFYYSEFPQKYKNLVSMEMPLYSKTYFYRGKLDILYKDRIFDLSLTDFKSSNGHIKKGSTKEVKYFYQLGGYAGAFDEMYKERGLKINQASILCIDKQTEILQEIVLSGNELEDYKNKFQNLVREYHIKHNQEYLIK